MRLKKSKWIKFNIIVYIFVILTGSFVLIFHFTENRILGWIIITLGLLNLAFSLMRINDKKHNKKHDKSR